MRYKRKTPVEAIQWNGDNPKEVYDFIIKTARTCCNMDDGSGNLNISYADLKGRKYKVVVPKFGWVVRDGKTLQFYKDATFRKTFEEVRDDDDKWRIDFYAFKDGPDFVCSGGYWRQCLPYNEDTAKLVGTTKSLEDIR